MMKCSFCGKEIENGAELCPHCGMILSLEEDNSNEPEIIIPEYTPNVFGAGIKKQQEETVARELPVNDTPESVPVVESIPEYVPEEFTPAEYDYNYAPPEYDSDFKADASEIEEPAEELTEEIAEEPVEEIEAQIAEEIPEGATEEIPAESTEEIPEEAAEEELTGDEAVPAEVEESFAQEAETAEEPAETSVQDEEVTSEEESPDVTEIRIPEEDVSYPEYEAFVPVEENYENVEDILSAEPEEEEYEEVPVVAVAQDGVSDSEETEEAAEDDDDTYVKPSKMKSGIATVVALCILLVCLVFAGGYVVKNVFPEKATTTTSAAETTPLSGEGEIDTTQEDTTEEDTTEDEETTVPEEDTTESEESTTVAEETTDNVEDETTTSVTTTKTPTTTKAPTTTKRPVTTSKPVTTTRRPVTTTRKPVTTTKAPSTTAPKATEGFGINNIPVKKPAKYLTTKYKAYVTVNSVRVRASASSDASLVLHLQKGSEVLAYGSENGFLYVYSTRFGVYGWISKAYLSTSRPTAATTTTPSGAVSPDKNGSGKVMYTTFTLNLRKGPGTNYGVVKTIPIKYPVKVIGYKSGVSGWAYVTDMTTGVNGWVSTAYLK